MAQFTHEAAAPAPAKPTTEAATTPATPSAVQAVRQYTVEAGDTLSKIAQRFYGKASEYLRIFEANRDRLSDPDKIRPGQVLEIPA